MGCICHLADLAAKSGMEALPVDIYIIIVVVTTSITAVNGSRTFVTSGVPSSCLSHRKYLSIVLLCGLV